MECQVLVSSAKSIGDVPLPLKEQSSNWVYAMPGLDQTGSLRIT